MNKKQPLAVCRRHWVQFIPQGIFSAIFMLLAIASLTTGDPIGFKLKMFAFLLLIAAGFAVYVAVAHKSDYIALTPTQIVGHKGVIRSKTLSTPLSKVQDIGLSSGLVGKALGYQTITIRSAGTAGTEFVFTAMARAQEFVDALEKAVAATAQ